MDSGIHRTFSHQSRSRLSLHLQGTRNNFQKNSAESPEKKKNFKKYYRETYSRPDTYENTLESAVLTGELKDNTQNTGENPPTEINTTSQATCVTRPLTHFQRKS